jgi:predicted O-methyltransferase YrrM
MINTHFVKHFFKHYGSATLIDVLHSPFVFRLYNSCIARKSSPQNTSDIQQLRAKLKRNSTRITQTDFGARSQQQPSRTKPISFFAKQHAKSTRINEILYSLVKEYQYNTCIELGTSLGLSASYIGKALPASGHLHSIEGAEQIAALAKQHISLLHLQNHVTIYNGTFDEILPGILNQHNTIDFAFIDGNHTYEATMRYFNLLIDKMHNNSVLVFDDIYWSKDMTKAWEQIKNHPKVTVTVDLFYVGLVYIRYEQVKQHFKLRVW